VILASMTRVLASKAVTRLPRPAFQSVAYTTSRLD
jgi:hypothetical protein